GGTSLVRVRKRAGRPKPRAAAPPPGGRVGPGALGGLARALAQGADHEGRAAEQQHRHARQDQDRDLHGCHDESSDMRFITAHPIRMPTQETPMRMRPMSVLNIGSMYSGPTRFSSAKSTKGRPIRMRLLMVV